MTTLSLLGSSHTGRETQRLGVLPDGSPNKHLETSRVTIYLRRLVDMWLHYDKYTGDRGGCCYNVCAMQIPMQNLDYLYWNINIRVPACWRHQMETFPASLALCAGNSPLIGEFLPQRQVTRSFDVFFDLRRNKVNSREAGDLRRHRAPYDITVTSTVPIKDDNHHTVVEMKIEWYTFRIVSLFFRSIICQMCFTQKLWSPYNISFLRCPLNMIWFSWISLTSKNETQFHIFFVFIVYHSPILTNSYKTPYMLISCSHEHAISTRVVLDWIVNFSTISIYAHEYIHRDIRYTG